ncbi:hypothetical protein MMC22_005642 [Lobaria immixta]|nr:hypothetical protein [Lobaria immixta]
MQLSFLSPEDQLDLKTVFSAELVAGENSIDEGKKERYLGFSKLLDSDVAEIRKSPFPEFALLMHLAQAKAHKLAITLPPGTIEKVANIVLRALLAEKDEKIANMSQKLEMMEQNLVEKTSVRPQIPIEYPPPGAVGPPTNDMEDLTAQLDMMSPGEAVVLLSTCADGISTSIKAWDVLARRYSDLTIYIALGVETCFVRDRLSYPTEDILDGGWLHEQDWSEHRSWAIYSVTKLLSGWYNRLFYNYYTYLLQQMQNGTMNRGKVSEAYGEGGSIPQRNSSTGYGHTGTISLKM